MDSPFLFAVTLDANQGESLRVVSYERETGQEEEQ